jgi:hydrogenase nickel incorporation protein HypA/HybF
MHELALSQSIVSLVCECGRREGFQNITRVVVEVGAAAAVEPEALAFCFDVAAADTMARDAVLVIEKVALEAACGACGAEFEMPNLAAPCPKCGAYGARLLRGRELRVKSLDGE